MIYANCMIVWVNCQAWCHTTWFNIAALKWGCQWYSSILRFLRISDSKEFPDLMKLFEYHGRYYVCGIYIQFIAVGINSLFFQTFLSEIKRVDSGNSLVVTSFSVFRFSRNFRLGEWKFPSKMIKNNIEYVTHLWIIMIYSIRNTFRIFFGLFILFREQTQFWFKICKIRKSYVNDASLNFFMLIPSGCFKFAM